MIKSNTAIWDITLREFKLSDSQKLMVFFGGMNVVGRKLEEIETVLEEEEGPLKAVEIIKERTREIRVQIVELLNRSREVKDILDMFKEPPPFIDFNPIIFDVHLPISLQRTAYRMEPHRAEVEDFVIVFDGSLVMVAAVCSLEERAWGVYDVRDRLVTMMKTVVPDFETTPPCLTHQAIALVNKLEEVSKDPRDTYLQIRPEKLVDILRNLYMRLYPEIVFFYDACEIARETTKVTEKINENETQLLSSLKNFLATTWRHPLKRTKIVGQMKMHVITILENLSNHSSLASELKEDRSEIEEYKAHNDLFDSFIKKVNLDEYTKPDTVDSESLIKIIEHARSETETYSSFMSTLVSTLVGAIIGSALTIVVSYFLGFL